MYEDVLSPLHDLSGGERRNNLNVYQSGHG